MRLSDLQYGDHHKAHLIYSQYVYDHCVYYTHRKNITAIHLLILYSGKCLHGAILHIFRRHAGYSHVQCCLQLS